MNVIIILVALIVAIVTAAWVALFSGKKENPDHDEMVIIISAAREKLLKIYRIAKGVNTKALKKVRTLTKDYSMPLEELTPEICATITKTAETALHIQTIGAIIEYFNNAVQTLNDDSSSKSEKIEALKTLKVLGDAEGLTRSIEEVKKTQSIDSPEEIYQRLLDNRETLLNDSKKEE